MNDRLVWIDCEMTGLSLEHDALIEVATLVTDYELNILGDGVDVIIKPPAAALDQMNELVTKMHSDSGLLTELEGGISLREAEELVLAYVREFVPEPGKAALAGNTVGTDRACPAAEAHDRAQGHANAWGGGGREGRQLRGRGPVSRQIWCETRDRDPDTTEANHERRLHESILSVRERT